MVHVHKADSKHQTQSDPLLQRHPQFQKSRQGQPNHHYVKGDVGDGVGKEECVMIHASPFVFAVPPLPVVVDWAAGEQLAEEASYGPGDGKRQSK